MRLSLGFSPCPNDCFIFYALVHGKIASQIRWDLHLEDVETLNQWARGARLDVTKLSYSAFGHVSRDYVMLRAGGALGRGVGPLVVAREPSVELSRARIAVPGGLTTASLLLALWQNKPNTVTMRYDDIMPAVVRGEVEAGLIIHESRFTYPSYGLVALQDLGVWWEGETGLPLPLGGIAAKRTLAAPLLEELNEAVRASLAYASDRPEETAFYVAAHAQEMDPAVRERHIALYVNALSDDVGEEGEAAVRELYRRARAGGLMPPSDAPLFAPL